MTPQERAMRWYRENAIAFEHVPKEVMAVVILTVQTAIKEGVEEEREGCRMIAAAEAESMAARAKLEGGSDPVRANQTHGAGRMARLIEALIRARSG